MFASAHDFPKFVAVGAAMEHELRKVGTSHFIDVMDRADSSDGKIPADCTGGPAQGNPVANEANSSELRLAR